MITERGVFVRIANIAHSNSATIEQMLDILESNHTIKTDHLPHNDENEILYPNGDIGIPLDADEETLATIHLAAAKLGVTTNTFMNNVAREKIKEMGIEGEHDGKDEIYSA